MRRFVWIAALSLASLPFSFAQEHGAAETPAEAHGQAASHGEEHAPDDTMKIVNFLMLLGILGYVIAKNGGAFFRGRTAEIHQAINEAREMKRQAEERAADMERRMAKLGDEIAALRENSKAEMEAEGTRIQAETAALVQRVQENAQREIEAAGKSASMEVRDLGARLALQLAEQKLKERLDPGAQAALAGRFVADLRRGGGSN